MFLDIKSPLASRVTSLIQVGDVETLEQLLIENEDLATAFIGDTTEARSLLHIATDHPGHRPNVASTMNILVKAGVDVNVRFIGFHSETALHWAASSDDVAAIDALLDAGADINATGAVIAGGTPLSDARAFLQRKAARRLIERGATVDLHDAATLGLMEYLEKEYAGEQGSDEGNADEKTSLAFWNACHGGSLEGAKFLRDQGADRNVVPPWDETTPLDAAIKSGNEELVEWLKSIGARRRAHIVVES